MNGWVLSTGFCDYTEDFTRDPRWEIPMAKDPGAIDADVVSRQRETGRSVFEGDSQPYAFLLPLYAEWNAEAGRFRPLLMLSITHSQPFNRPLRRQILDHAWNAFHEIEMALMAQEELNRAHELARQVSVVHLNRSLGHSLPKFVFKPLEYYALQAHRMYECMAYHLKMSDAVDNLH